MAATPFPLWLTVLSIVSLTVGIACAAFIAIDEIRRPQGMWIMNLVWPLTALFGGPFWLAGYLKWGRTGRAKSDSQPFAIAVAKASSHCGAGCALGDLIAEWLAFAVPSVALLFGWKTLFVDKTFAVWILDFLLAFVLGIGFQYFTLKPMGKLSAKAALLQALKADAASISAWQLGMYGAMALIQFAWFAPRYGAPAAVDSPQFWFAMQIAMLAGFATSCPANAWLLKIGVKEPM